MKIPTRPRALSPKSIQDDGSPLSSSQLELAKQTLAVAMYNCRSCWQTSFMTPLGAPVAKIVDHTSDAQFRIGNPEGSGYDFCNFEVPYLHQAGQGSIIVEASLVSTYNIQLGFRFSIDDWTTSAISQQYSEGYAVGHPAFEMSQDGWGYSSQWDNISPKSIVLRSELVSPTLPNATTDRTCKLEFFVRAETDYTAGILDYGGDHYVYIESLRIFDNPDRLEF